MNGSIACAWPCLIVLFVQWGFAYAFPDLPPDVARVFGDEDWSSEIANEPAVDEVPDHVDPRFDMVVKNWREERREHYRRLTHNNHLGDEAPRHASIHFHWRPPRGEPFGEITAWYAETTVTSYHEDSFFNVNGHGFGYSGIQAVDFSPFKGKVLFSIWDQECTGNDLSACPVDKRAEITQCGHNVTCTRFGGEGTGAKSFFEWDGWTIGTKYSFLTVATRHGTTQVEYTGYFYAPELGYWRVLASMKVNNGDKNWWIHGQYSFVEQWSRKNPEGIRWAKFGPVFKRNGAASTTLWDPIYRAKLYNTAASSEDTTHINWNKSAYIFEMGIGGNVQKSPDANMNDIWSVLPTLRCATPLTLWVDSELASSLPTGQPAPQGVACGTHDAAVSCPLCGTGDACAGDCEWVSGSSTCVASDARRRESSSGRRRASRRLSGNQVKCHEGGTTSTYAPAFLPVSLEVLVMSMAVANVNYAQLTASYSTRYAFEQALKSVMVQEANSADEAVTVVLSSGSVVAQIQIIPPIGQSATSLQTMLSSSATLNTNLLTRINAVPDIDAVSSGAISVGSITYRSQTITTTMDQMTKKFFFLAHVSAAPRHAEVVSLLAFAALVMSGLAPWRLSL